MSDATIRVAAAAIANARGGRRGVPPITNILDVLPARLCVEVTDDAKAALEAVGASDLLAALRHVRSIIVEAAATGFNCTDGDWAERLFASQAVSKAAVDKAEGRPA